MKKFKCKLCEHEWEGRKKNPYNVQDVKDMIGTLVSKN